MKVIHKVFGSILFAAWIYVAEATYLSWIPSLNVVSFLNDYPVIQLILACGLVQLVPTLLGKYGKKGVPLALNRFVLLCISLLLTAVALPVAVMWAPVKIAYKYPLKHFWENLSKYFLGVAHAFDQTGNRFGEFLFTDLFLSKGHGFNNEDHTISNQVAEKEKLDALTWLGEFVVWMLNAFDPNHTEKARNNVQYNDGHEKS